MSLVKPATATGARTSRALQQQLLGLVGPGSRVIVIHDPGHGWCVSTEVDDPAPVDASARVYRVICFAHEFADSVDEAVTKAIVAHAGRFGIVTD